MTDEQARKVIELLEVMATRLQSIETEVGSFTKEAEAKLHKLEALLKKTAGD